MRRKGIDQVLRGATICSYSPFPMHFFVNPTFVTISNLGDLLLDLFMSGKAQYMDNTSGEKSKST